MSTKFYLLCVLIEDNNSVSDNHKLYRNEEKARNAFTRKIKSCHEKYDSGEVLIDLKNCYEFRNPGGYGFIVSIEEMKPI